MLSGIRTSRVSDTDNTYASPSGSIGSGELSTGVGGFLGDLKKAKSKPTDHDPGAGQPSPRGGGPLIVDSTSGSVPPFAPGNPPTAVHADAVVHDTLAK